MRAIAPVTGVTGRSGHAGRVRDVYRRTAPGSLPAERLVELRYVPAGDGHGLVGARVGGDEHRSLESLLYLPDSADIDQEPAVYAEESLSFGLLCQPVETTS